MLGTAHGSHCGMAQKIVICFPKYFSGGFRRVAGCISRVLWLRFPHVPSSETIASKVGGWTLHLRNALAPCPEIRVLQTSASAALVTPKPAACLGGKLR